MDVRESKNAGTIVIDMKGPFGESVIETKRTPGEIYAWLMGMG